MHKALLAAATGALMLASAPAQAQNSGLVVVDLSDANVELLNNLARDLNLEVTDNNVEVLKNINVQVPIGLAAAICGIDANVLASQRKKQDFACTAENNTAALTKAVRQKLPANTQ